MDFGEILGGIGNALMPGAGSLFNAGVSFLGQQQTNQVNSARTADTNNANIAIAQANNQFSRENSATQNAFSERMSNSAYQRSTADMLAAGLNPMLAYGHGGASTPSPTSATPSSVNIQTPEYHSPITAGLNGAQAGQRLYNETTKTVAEINRIHNQNLLTKEEIEQSKLDQIQRAEQTNTQKQLTRETTARADKEEVHASTAKIEQAIASTQLANLPAQQKAQLAALLSQASAATAQAQLTAVNELLAKTKLPGARANEEIDEFLGVWGAAGERLLKAVGLGAGVFFGLRKAAAPLPSIPKFSNSKSGSVTIHNYPLNGPKNSTTWQNPP
jgi:hypothetical protein